MWRRGSRRTADRRTASRRSRRRLLDVDASRRSATPFATRSMRALHALAGNRAGDEHDLAVDARDHPPAGGGLLDRRADRASLIAGPSSIDQRSRSRTSTRRQPEALAHQAIDRRVARARERVGGHRRRETARAPRRPRAPARARVGSSSARARLLQQLARRAPPAARPAPAAPRRAGRRAVARAASSSRATRSISASNCVAERPARARRRQPQHDALEMRRQRLTATAAG